MHLGESYKAVVFNLNQFEQVGFRQRSWTYNYFSCVWIKYPILYAKTAFNFFKLIPVIERTVTVWEINKLYKLKYFWKEWAEANSEFWNFYLFIYTNASFKSKYIAKHTLVLPDLK